MSYNVLILGATSAIARNTAAAFATRGDNLYLASRDMEELRRISSDLQVRYGVKVSYGLFDAAATDAHPAFFHSVLEEIHELHGADRPQYQPRDQNTQEQAGGMEWLLVEKPEYERRKDGADRSSSRV